MIWFIILGGTGFIASTLLAFIAFTLGVLMDSYMEEKEEADAS